MTMARVQNGKVTYVGLPDELRPLPLDRLRDMGWHKVVGTPKPSETPKPGYQWEYGAEWSVKQQTVLGTWTQQRVPQPFPSWTWDNGWQPPVPMPDDGAAYTWHESTQSWQSEGININTATKAELVALSGVGSTLAQAIIDGRPWASVNDLTSLRGISQTMVDGWDVTV